MLNGSEPAMSERLYRAWEATHLDGGGTFDREGNPLMADSGFMVGGVAQAAIIPAPLLSETVFAALIGELQLQGVGDGVLYIGTWLDKDDNRVYVELSEHVDLGSYSASLEHALRLARERGEKCIWDVKNQQAIDVDGWL